MSGKLSILVLVASMMGVSYAQGVQCGDCNQDGFSTDILDALTSAQIAAALLVPIGEQPCACDANNDSVINILDTLVMAQVATGLPVALTCPAPTCGVVFNSPPEVTINVPTGGDTVLGNVLVDFDTVDADGDLLDVTIELSTNAGASFFIPTAGPPGSVMMNPTGLLPAALAQTYRWDSVADMIGTLAPFVVVLRVTADDGMFTTEALAIVTVNNLIMCQGTLTCGTGFNLMFGAGSGARPPAAFDFSTDSVAVEIDTSGRAPGDAVDIFTANLTDDFDLYVGLPGTPCGDPDPANYVLATIAVTGNGGELQITGDADLIALGEFVNVVVHHFDPNPTGSCDLVAQCRAVDICDGQIACGDPPLSGTTGTLHNMGALPVSGLFTGGPMGDTFFYDIDTSGMPVGSGLEVSILNQTGPQLAGLMQWPGVPCAYPDTYSWSGVQSFFSMPTEDFFLFTPAELDLFLDDRIPMIIHNLDAGPATFDISVRCPALGPCESTLVCGSNQIAGQIDMGTSYMFIGNQHTFGPGGDSDSYALDLSGRVPGDEVLITLRSLTSDCDLFLMPAGQNCGWPLPWNSGASANMGVGVDDTLLITDGDIASFGTDQLALVVYRPDPAGGGDYDISVDCRTPISGCTGTVEGVLDEAMVPLPLQVMGDTTAADATSMITCTSGGTGPDHVYEFIPSMTRTYTFSLCASMYDTAIEIKEGNCISGATIACDDDFCSAMTFESQINSAALTAGTSYYIIIGGWQGDFGAYTLDITAP